MDEKNLWDQGQGLQPGINETNFAYARFLNFLRQGPTRKTGQLARAEQISPQSISLMATKYNWHERARAYDKSSNKKLTINAKIKKIQKLKLPEKPPNPREKFLKSLEQQNQLRREQKKLDEQIKKEEDNDDKNSTINAGGGGSFPPPPPRPPAGESPDSDSNSNNALSTYVETTGYTKEQEYLKGLDDYRRIYGQLGFAMALESYSLFPTIKECRQDLQRTIRIRRDFIANDPIALKSMTEAISRQVLTYTELCKSMIALANSGRDHWGAVIGIEEILKEAYGPNGSKS